MRKRSTARDTEERARGGGMCDGHELREWTFEAETFK